MFEGNQFVDGCVSNQFVDGNLQKKYFKGNQSLTRYNNNAAHNDFMLPPDLMHDVIQHTNPH